MIRSSPRSALLLVSALAIPLALAWVRPAGDKLAFHPEAGSSLQKTFSSKFELRLDDMSANVNGLEIDPTTMGDPQVTMRSDTTVGVADEYIKLKDGQPLELERSYDTLNGKVEFEYSAGEESDTKTTDLKSELEGKQVVFKWNEKEGRYDLSFAEDGESDEKLLERLPEDMDLRMILPKDEVKAGDSWDVPSKNLATLMFPGGSLSLRGEGEAEDDEKLQQFLEEMDLDLDELVGKLLDGTFKATYSGIKEVDGLKLAAIDLAAEVHSSNDFSDLVKRGIEKAKEISGSTEDFEMTVESASLELSFKGEGQLLWDAAKGHMHSFDLSGETGLSLKVSVSATAGGQTETVRFSAELSGDATSKVETAE